MSKQPKPPFPKETITPPGIEEKMKTKPHYHAEAYKPAGKLKNKVALITGGDSGIGRAVAFLFAREGANLALVYLPEEQTDASKIKTEIEKLGQEVLLIPGDVREADFCKEAVEKTVRQFNHIDILVNNAAFQKHRSSIEEVSIEQWENTFVSNIYSYYYMTKFALPYMKQGGSIINTGSITGIEGNKELLDYSSTKGAIHAFTKSLAQNLIDKGIRVNCVAPGPVWTPLNPAERKDNGIKEFGADTPLGRPAQPEELAPAYVFLASNADSSYISGMVLPVLGGKTIST
ncbi:3-oxoacyl-ACP reductase [Legionella lansingensis]|uniref:3-oxoacyl-ACP reductase n=1 Tax=Legionella lansingensis TaxID=45067 RepID=A0A0W0VS14_9GAMM|nr:SDR family oxidoreductase [Legionella lansingensis]KTD22863.1 3-oxoacyl-ACP reductase [Legionella lansingensis]SNV53674.1 3-oxoacyl-ACP reductase [Legionella lansingensis]